LTGKGRRKERSIMNGVQRSLLVLALFFVTHSLRAAPAPLPRSSGTAPTLAQLEQLLLERGIVVGSVRRGPGKDEWVVHLELRQVSSRHGLNHRIVKSVQAVGLDERSALRALLTKGGDAAQLYQEDLLSRQREFDVYGFVW
jgi:hypothetical protein